MKKIKPRRGRPRIGQAPIRNAAQLVRPLVHALKPYVPGEQPQLKGLIKLNTNENPFPPSPKVLSAIKDAVDDRLRLYPSPTAQTLREKLAKLHDCPAENIIIGNGSDELLALASRAFVEPAASSVRLRLGHRQTLALYRQLPSQSTIQYFTPSYSLYSVLADIHGVWKNPLPLNPDFSLPSLNELKHGKVWDFDAALTYITTPNAPSGHGYATSQLEAICRAQQGVVVLDEAYAEFAEEDALKLAMKCPNVLVARTFSKAYSLCYQRVGYFVGSKPLIAALDKIRDSYNVNGLGQVGALATLDELPYYRENFQRIKLARNQLADALTALEFEVFPSQTNFLLVRPPRSSAEVWLEQLRQRKILVRWWDSPDVRDYFRITIGTEAEVEALIKTIKRILATM